MLDYEGAELLLIASRNDETGLEAALGEGRGKGEFHISYVIVVRLNAICTFVALTDAEAEEGHASIEAVLQELALDANEIIVEPLKGNWI